ncbi:MAG: hypothetical protein ACRD2B_11145 [Terriglobia bacterium]
MASGTSKWFIAVIVAIAIIVGIDVMLTHHRPSPNVTPAPMTAAEQDYLKQVEVTHPRMSVASNFLGETLYYFDGTLRNQGSWTIRKLGLRLTFLDPFGEVVLRKMEYPITPQTPPLKPGESRALHFTFEHLPAEWNQGPPMITASYASF